MSYGTRTTKNVQILDTHDKIRVPKKTSLTNAGDSVNNTKEIVLNTEDNIFYGHDGSSWVSFSNVPETAPPRSGITNWKPNRRNQYCNN